MGGKCLVWAGGRGGGGRGWVELLAAGPKGFISSLFTVCLVTLQVSHRGKCDRCSHAPTSSSPQPILGARCWMNTSWSLPLRLTEEETFCLVSQSSLQVPTAGNLFNNTPFLNLLLFLRPPSLPCLISLPLYQCFLGSS